ncbi:MAG: NAD(P)/FAD-dependent oxidoreductase [Ruminococcus callidus]
MYDIIIIGSGPAGLTAAIYASRARLQTLVLERDTMGAGQIAVTEQVDNYPGLPHIGGYELGEKFREHAESLGASICENDVERLTKQDGVFQIALADGTTVSAKSVIYAAGTSYRKLDVPGRNCRACRIVPPAMVHSTRERQLQSSAAAIRRWEMPCIWHAWQRLVYLVHRRDAFRANAALQESVKQTENIVLVTNAVPTAVVGEKRVSALRIDHNGQPEELILDGVFVAIGSVPNTEPLRGLADLDAHGYVKAGEDGITSLDGLLPPEMSAQSSCGRWLPLRQTVQTAWHRQNSICCRMKKMVMR